jgi:hypothetical protein
MLAAIRSRLKRLERRARARPAAPDWAALVAHLTRGAPLPDEVHWRQLLPHLDDLRRPVDAIERRVQALLAESRPRCGLLELPNGDANGPTGEAASVGRTPQAGRAPAG